MEKKINRTLNKWVPLRFSDREEYTDYKTLHFLAQYSMEKMCNSVDDQLNAMDAIRVVNLVYVSGTRHDRNAIEKETSSFLAAKGMDTPALLKKHQVTFSQQMKQAYLKTRIDN